MSHQQPIVSAIDRRGAHESRPPIMSDAEQTRFSWARQIRSLDELPPAYRPFIQSLPGDGLFPYVVLTPTYAGFMRREPEKLVCCVGEQLYIVEVVKDKLQTIAYALADIHYLEIGAILLNDWLQIRGRASDGTFAVTRFKFNAVTERLFAPFVEKIRGAAHVAAPGIDRDAELKKLDDADLLSFKFRNYARRSLLPGARLTGVVSQPEIRKTIVRIFGHAFRRIVAMSHILILTDRELITVCDDPDSPKGPGEARYGGVWDYIPLHAITGIEQTTQDSGWLVLTVQLPCNDRVEALFSPDRQADLERFVTQLKACLPAAP